jgi:hypothetical protein
MVIIFARYDKNIHIYIFQGYRSGCAKKRSRRSLNIKELVKFTDRQTCERSNLRRKGFVNTASKERGLQKRLGSCPFITTGGLTIDGSGDAYVVDHVKNRTEKIVMVRFLQHGQFKVTDVTVGSAGQVYVSDPR